jgi:Fur family iron response transcriptional regulator
MEGMNDPRPFAGGLARLKEAGLRPTRQRVQLLRILEAGGHRHLPAVQLIGEAAAAGLHVSLATIYNTLNQFTKSGLLREVVVEPGRSYFDTNTGDHHHFYFESEGRLQDIPAEQIALAALPPAPAGTAITRVDVIVRILST